MLAKNHPPLLKDEGMNRRALGIDFGERRIGLALSDPNGRMALPLCTIERQTDRRAAYQIADLIRREEVHVLVMGDPKGLDGRIGAASERVRGFGKKLTRITGLPIRWVDETLTTVEATARLQEIGADAPTHRDRRDAVAAQILLQEALDLSEVLEDRANEPPVKETPVEGTPVEGAPMEGAPLEGAPMEETP